MFYATWRNRYAGVCAGRTLATVNAYRKIVLEELGVQILLNNTHHLRSGVEMVRSLGGVQRFMAWDKAILTDETAKRGVVPAPYFFGRDSGGTNPATR